ncbi:Uncharacterised protein [Candidatus Anstonella stagnisolia]|nr:Uncharacterised protein [Candidatus Anstonella stagnisolia]
MEKEAVTDEAKELAIELARSIAIGKDGILLPTQKSVVLLHKRMMDYSKTLTDIGIDYSLRYDGVLSMLESRLRDKTYRKTPLENAIFVSEELFFKVLSEHPFNNGNKRAAWFTAFTFLTLNLGNYVNKLEGKKYECIAMTDEYPKERQLQEAQRLEILAEWHGEKRKKERIEFLEASGIHVKSEVKEEHIRQYLRKLLASMVREKN